MLQTIMESIQAGVQIMIGIMTGSMTEGGPSLRIMSGVRGLRSLPGRKATGTGLIMRGIPRIRPSRRPRGKGADLVKHSSGSGTAMIWIARSGSVMVGRTGRILMREMVVMRDWTVIVTGTGIGIGIEMCRAM
jgi:hypothetical protein